MKPFHIDEEKAELCLEERTISLYSEEAFQILSRLWLKTGWNAHYHYTFTWMGVPVLQLPEDLMRLQEVIVSNPPDVIIETGIAMGGSLLFYATLCHGLGHGKVIGIDKDLRPQNRKRLEEHHLSPYLQLIEGNSVNPQIIAQIDIQPGQTVMVILDSNHSKEHVLQELELFAPIVSSGFYLVVADGFKGEVSDVPRGKRFGKRIILLRQFASFLKSILSLR